MPTVKNPGPPKTIYLQGYDEYTGNLLDFVSDNVTWRRDRINDDDAVYILATPELAELLLVLARDSENWAQDNNDCSEEAVQAHDLAARIKDSLG